ncbi:MAG: hypothetical protein K6T85_07975, partial [Gorillibacterium sp.]|nr:hypothetical protein [Gorillibacterium sp.]
MKSIKYFFVYMIIIQIVLPWCIPYRYVFHNRIEYKISKDNLHNNYIDNLDVTLNSIKREITNKHLKDYIIILGDSVMYG